MMNAIRRFFSRPEKIFIVFSGVKYDARKYEKVCNPSDMPPCNWRPPNGDWNNWHQDKMIVRKKDGAVIAR